MIQFSRKKLLLACLNQTVTVPLGLKVPTHADFRSMPSDINVYPMNNSCGTLNEIGYFDITVEVEKSFLSRQNGNSINNVLTLN